MALTHSSFKTKRLHIYLPLVAGILTPSLVIFVLEVFVARRFGGRVSPLTAAIDILHRQFAAGHNLFLLMLLAMIPFVALVVCVKAISLHISGARLECTFWGGFIAVWGLTVYGHFSVWYALYAPGRRMSSTAVVAFLFIPFYCLFFLVVGLVIGYLIGWGVSFLPPFKEAKRTSRRRKRGKIAGYCDQEDWRKFEMKISVGVLSALLLAALCLLESDSHGQDNFSRVARIFGRDIYLVDLNPTDDEFRMLKRVEDSMRGKPYQQDRSDDQIISDVRSRKLAGLIWDSIWTEFERTHDVKPSEAEIDDCVRAMEAFTAMDPNRLLPDDPKISPKMKKEIEREVAEHIVTQWKRNKALYEEYGGIVLFQQLNPMEAFGAMRKLLEIHQAKGDFEIYDDSSSRSFGNIGSESLYLGR